MMRRGARREHRMGLLAPALAVGAALLAKRFLSRPVDLRGKVALITGGSRGLGYATARAFATKGCALVLCSRNEEQLALASQQLEAEGARVMTIRCDVSDRQQVGGMVRRVMNEMGRIDILVNNAGIIQVGPAQQMQAEDFEQALAVNFWGTLYPILETLPYMTEAASGTIVNVTSLGGKVSVPHLIPYSCAKFAAVALSEGLRAELASDGINVLTVAPGLMRTGSFINAFFKGQQEREYAWFTASANLPLLSMSPDRAARRIVQAVQQRRSEIVLSAPAKSLVLMHGLWPEFAQQLLGLTARMLPAPAAANGASRRGSEFTTGDENAMLRLVNRAGKPAVDQYQWGREMKRIS